MQDCHILITRPEPENSLSCERISAHGWTAIPLPMLDIVAIEEAAQKAVIRAQVFNIDTFDYVLFVSKNAARLAGDWLDACWPMLPANVHWIGIGQGTTQALIEEGIPAISNPGQTTEALLEWLKPVKMKDQKILIVRGEGGRPELGNKLQERGANVSYLSLYERRKPRYSAQTFFMLPDIHLIWVTSGESLDNLSEYVTQHKPEWKTLPILTPSARVNQQAKEMGWINASCANGADDNSLIKATEFHIGKQND
ncbi:uroporphyrinogen-III synthase [Marinomonas sp. M1K-6]|uniref:Uroporphyrinogen-III synthase n=1 Tax=Marinomonas profundi TaxID=2726122 RepID=A0A847R4T6_9GAMM|nr:uroporphyrinogen-III synthase [Marinomonas profundi]NLQ19015.1 uroporphyrinogen-III synthase [Marinomonas profundi]UDV02072.1 uroporphyrinogen-III synthase [Marinomonas profundi]